MLAYCPNYPVSHTGLNISDKFNIFNYTWTKQTMQFRAINFFAKL